MQKHLKGKFPGRQFPDKKISFQFHWRIDFFTLPKKYDYFLNLTSKSGFFHIKIKVIWCLTCSCKVSVSYSISKLLLTISSETYHLEGEGKNVNMFLNYYREIREKII